jgi:hypothetical protein
VPIQARTLPAGLEAYPQPYAGYNDVPDRYSGWLVAQRNHGWAVIDIHTPMSRYLAERRALDSAFKFAGDGVHLNEEGHWLIARECLRYFGAPDSVIDAPDAMAMSAPDSNGDRVLGALRKKQRILSDAWLTQTGHERPGMTKGLSVEQAEIQARELDRAP